MPNLAGRKQPCAYWHPSPIQTILSAPESHRIMPCGSRAEGRKAPSPPVGNFTLPRRMHRYIAILIIPHRQPVIINRRPKSNTPPPITGWLQAKRKTGANCSGLSARLRLCAVYGSSNTFTSFITSPFFIALTTSMPDITWPKTVCTPSKCGCGSWTMKNWQLPVSRPRCAIDIAPVT